MKKSTLFLAFAFALSLSLMAPTNAHAQITVDPGAIAQFLNKVKQEISRISTVVKDTVVNSKAFVAMGGAVKNTKSKLTNFKQSIADKQASALEKKDLKKSKQAQDAAKRMEEKKESAKQELEDMGKQAAEDQQKLDQELANDYSKAGATAEKSQEQADEFHEEVGNIEDLSPDSPYTTAPINYPDGMLPSDYDNKVRSEEIYNRYRKSPATGGQSYLQSQETVSFAASSVASCSIDGRFICSDQLMAYCELNDVEALKDPAVMTSCLKRLSVHMTDPVFPTAQEAKLIYDAILYDTTLNTTTEIMSKKVEASQFVEKELAVAAEASQDDADIRADIASLAVTNQGIQKQLNSLIEVYSTYMMMDAQSRLGGFDRSAVAE